MGIFHVFKLCKRYQIAQRVTNIATYIVSFTISNFSSTMPDTILKEFTKEVRFSLAPPPSLNPLSVATLKRIKFVQS